VKVVMLRCNMWSVSWLSGVANMLLERLVALLAQRQTTSTVPSTIITLG
jgi:hypothetical protein